MKKYDKSFSVDREDIPLKCPICGKEFLPLTDYIETNYYADGYRTMLYCNNGDCNFKKVLEYETHEDVEQRIADEDSENESYVNFDDE